MKAAARLGFWVAAGALLFGSAPTRLSALPLGDTFSYAKTNDFYGSAGAGGDGADIGTLWTPVTPTTFASLSLAVTFNSSISASNPNPFPTAQNWDVFIYWTPHIWLQLPNGTTIPVSGANQNVYVSAVVPPNGALFARGLFVDMLLIDVVGAACVGPDPLRVYMMDEVTAGTQFGSGSHAATFTASITYNSVPDRDDSVLLLGSALVGLLMLTRGQTGNRAKGGREK